MNYFEDDFSKDLQAGKNYTRKGLDYELVRWSKYSKEEFKDEFDERIKVETESVYTFSFSTVFGKLRCIIADNQGNKEELAERAHKAAVTQIKEKLYQVYNKHKRAVNKINSNSFIDEDNQPEEG